MIVPMKKVSLIVRECDRKAVLKKLRKLGVMQIEISDGSGKRLDDLNEKAKLLENTLFLISDKKGEQTQTKSVDAQEALKLSERIIALNEQRSYCIDEISAIKTELDRLESWGEISPNDIAELSEKGITISLCEMSPAEYDSIKESITAIMLSRSKSVVRIAVIARSTDDSTASIDGYKVKLPEVSTSELKEKLNLTEKKLQDAGDEINRLSEYSESIRQASARLYKDIEFETYQTGMSEENLSSDDDQTYTVAYFSGYIPADDLDSLKAVARENSWGLIADDPTGDDNVPTKLKNNRFVSLIYPLTDFLGTVPGYFEYDISAWFLGFILIFFGIIFGDGGYGLLILGVSGALIFKNKKAKKDVPPLYYLLALFGGATILWGILTCTWFGLDAKYLPEWLKALSVPVISNVYSEKLWYPFWTGGKAGLTTAQNLQILCFSLALIQLSVAHIKGMIRNRKSLKMLGDLGSVFQLIGIFYVVLSLVVNGDVFGIGLVISGIPVGMIAIAFVGVGFVMSFIFANYEGSVKKAVLNSLQNIVSILLGVVNVFSDIVSYIRLWAVGLAGAAISATVNELASPMLGNLMFMVFAVLILVFGHGLNMILNVLSVIVHGVRLNTLEFSSHLDMSWSGHKYKPFEE